MEKYVYMFSEGNKDMFELLGGKGANLCEMTNMGIPVPQGFVVSTKACTSYFENNKKMSKEIADQILQSVEKMEQITGKQFGNKENALLFAIRSGARASMPGMMDTVLSLGLNDQIVEHMAQNKQNARFVYDCYRRFIQMFADVVMGVKKHTFEVIIDKVKAKKNIKNDVDLTADDLFEIIDLFKNYYKQETNEEFPQDVKFQLLQAVEAVFRSWDNDRANTYRRLNNIPYSWGTAVNVQSMVFGNLNKESGTGVAFTRNPATGKNAIFGEYLLNAQGEDVVAGVRTPLHIETLKQDKPEIYLQFEQICKKLEHNYKDMQDIEFTIENNKLFILQTRSGKRTAVAALQVACDLVEEGICTKEEAIMKIDAKGLDALLHLQFDDEALKNTQIIAEALPASPGAACGKIAFSSKHAKEMAKDGNKVVLVRLETSPEDIEGMTVCEGVLTSRGGMTSHAAVVARGMGTACVAGCANLVFEEDYCKIGDNKFVEGDIISFDGSTGYVYVGQVATVNAKMSKNFETVMAWAKQIKTLGVRANADTKKDAQMAVEFGAEGIGLCRTEHMFFSEQRIEAMREMIVATNIEEREVALKKLKEYQKTDFENLFEELNGKPVTIRFLDPPLHEFLPKSQKDINNLSRNLKVSPAKVLEVVNSLHEFNPMMGHRGLRLAVTYPEIAKMQTEAVLEAAINAKNKGLDVCVEIMIPLTAEAKEYRFVENIVKQAAEQTLQNYQQKIDYKIGTMIEVPRAALTADQIAQTAQFFSFGTNDLTQMTFGFSRDDAAKFLEIYYENKLLENDPFMHIDQNGVGKLVEMAKQKGRSVSPNLKLGVCGEHGGDPVSVEYFHKIGLNYVSCSPYRVPIAIMAAAQAAVRNK